MALRVVVAGLGSRGDDWARVLQATDVATLVGVCEPDQAARARAAHVPADVPLESALEPLVRAVSPDAVIVATPPQSHASLAEQAIALGLGVLVEKPFTLDLSSAAHLVRLADARRVPLLVAQNYRYMRAHRSVRRVIAEGTLGDLRSVTCHYWRATHIVHPWLAALDAPALWESGVHHLDALRFCLGRRIVGVSADVSTTPHSNGLRGSSARVIVEFEGGIGGEYSVSWDAPGHEFFEAGQQFYERITGTRGTLHVLQRWLVLCCSGRWPRLVARGRRTEPEEVELLRQLARAHEGDAVECSGRDNLQTMAVLEACQQSWRTRRWIDPQVLLGEVT